MPYTSSLPHEKEKGTVTLLLSTLLETDGYVHRNGKEIWTVNNNTIPSVEAGLEKKLFMIMKKDQLSILTFVCLSTGEERARENVVGTTDPQSTGGAAGAEPSSSRRRLHCCIRVTTVQVRKALWGVAMVMCVCSSWAGSTQLAKLTFKQFDAPFTLTWFATTWNCLFFPLYYIGHLCKSPERQTPRQRFRWGDCHCTKSKQVNNVYKALFF